MKDYSRGAQLVARRPEPSDVACDLKPVESMPRPWDGGSASPESDQQVAGLSSQLIEPAAMKGAGAT